jgi:tyrosyl-tRNA synthetase
VWLNEAQLSHYDYWQFWRNTDDRDVGKFLRLFTDVPIDEIARLEALGGSEINQAKIILANEATALCRGAEAAIAAESTARQLFEQGAAGGDLPTFEVPSDSIGIIDALVSIGFAASKGEARRLVAGGGARVDGVQVTDESHLISIASGEIQLSSGKKKHGILRFG